MNIYKYKYYPGQRKPMDQGFQSKIRSKSPIAYQSGTSARRVYKSPYLARAAYSSDNRPKIYNKLQFRQNSKNGYLQFNAQPPRGQARQYDQNAKKASLPINLNVKNNLTTRSRVQTLRGERTPSKIRRNVSPFQLASGQNRVQYGVGARFRGQQGVSRKIIRSISRRKQVKPGKNADLRQDAAIARLKTGFGEKVAVSPNLGSTQKIQFVELKRKKNEYEAIKKLNTESKDYDFTKSKKVNFYSTTSQMKVNLPSIKTIVSSQRIQTNNPRSINSNVTVHGARQPESNVAGQASQRSRETKTNRGKQPSVTDSLDRIGLSKSTVVQTPIKKGFSEYEFGRIQSNTNFRPMESNEVRDKPVQGGRIVRQKPPQTRPQNKGIRVKTSNNSLYLAKKSYKRNEDFIKSLKTSKVINITDLENYKNEVSIEIFQGNSLTKEDKDVSGQSRMTKSTVQKETKQTPTERKKKFDGFFDIYSPETVTSFIRSNRKMDTAKNLPKKAELEKKPEAAEGDKKDAQMEPTNDQIDNQKEPERKPEQVKTDGGEGQPEAREESPEARSEELQDSKSETESKSGSMGECVEMRSRAGYDQDDRKSSDESRVSEERDTVPSNVKKNISLDHVKQKRNFETASNRKLVSVDMRKNKSNAGVSITPKNVVNLKFKKGAKPKKNRFQVEETRKRRKTTRNADAGKKDVQKENKKASKEELNMTKYEMESFLMLKKDKDINFDFNESKLSEIAKGKLNETLNDSLFYEILNFKN